MIKKFIEGLVTIVAIVVLIFWISSCVDNRRVKFKYQDKVKATCGFYEGYQGAITSLLKIGEVDYLISSEQRPYSFWVNQSCLELINEKR